MATYAGMKGIAIETQGGQYVFYPAYDPAADEKCAAVPLSNGSNFILGIKDAQDLAANDVTRCRPVQGGAYIAIPDNCQKIPFQITAGVASKTVATGYTESLGRVVFYWDGEDDLFLSGSSSSLSNIQVDDGIYMKSPRTSGYYRVDPSFDDWVRITSVSNLVREGINVLDFTLENNYGTTISASAIYLYQGSA